MRRSETRAQLSSAVIGQSLRDVLETSRPLAYHVQCVGALASRSASVTLRCHCVTEVNKGIEWWRFGRFFRIKAFANTKADLIPLQ